MVGYSGEGTGSSAPCLTWAWLLACSLMELLLVELPQSCLSKTIPLSHRWLCYAPEPTWTGHPQLRSPQAEDSQAPCSKCMNSARPGRALPAA